MSSVPGASQPQPSPAPHGLPGSSGSGDDAPGLTSGASASMSSVSATTAVSTSPSPSSRLLADWGTDSSDTEPPESSKSPSRDASKATLEQVQDAFDPTKFDNAFDVDPARPHAQVSSKTSHSTSASAASISDDAFDTADDLGGGSSSLRSDPWDMDDMETGLDWSSMEDPADGLKMRARRIWPELFMNSSPRPLLPLRPQSPPCGTRINVTSPTPLSPPLDPAADQQGSETPLHPFSFEDSEDKSTPSRSLASASQLPPQSLAMPPPPSLARLFSPPPQRDTKRTPCQSCNATQHGLDSSPGSSIARSHDTHSCSRSLAPVPPTPDERTSRLSKATAPAIREARSRKNSSLGLSNVTAMGSFSPITGAKATLPSLSQTYARELASPEHAGGRTLTRTSKYATITAETRDTLSVQGRASPTSLPFFTATTNSESGRLKRTAFDSLPKRGQRHSPLNPSMSPNFPRSPTLSATLIGSPLRNSHNDASSTQSLHDSEHRFSSSPTSNSPLVNSPMDATTRARSPIEASSLSPRLASQELGVQGTATVRSRSAGGTIRPHMLSRPRSSGPAGGSLGRAATSALGWLPASLSRRNSVSSSVCPAEDGAHSSSPVTLSAREVARRASPVPRSASVPPADVDQAGECDGQALKSSQARPRSKLQRLISTCKPKSPMAKISGLQPSRSSSPVLDDKGVSSSWHNAHERHTKDSPVGTMLSPPPDPAPLVIGQMRFDPIQRTWLRNAPEGAQEEADLLRAFEDGSDDEGEDWDSAWLTGKADSRIDKSPRRPARTHEEFVENGAPEAPESRAGMGEASELPRSNKKGTSPVLRTLRSQPASSPSLSMRLRSFGSGSRPIRRKKSMMTLTIGRSLRRRPASTAFFSDTALTPVHITLTPELERQYMKAESLHDQQMRLLGLEP